MIDITQIVLAIIKPEFVLLFLALTGLGSILKYRTPLDNNLIPIVLAAVALVFGVSWGFLSSAYAGSARIFDAIIISGIFRGGSSAMAAVFGWDTIFGFFKYRKKRNATITNEGGSL